jgi:hypothetical protein
MTTRVVFINADGIVVNVISGALTEIEQQRFLADYRVLFGAESIVAVDADTAVWIGGSYTDGTFTAPPEPEPVPIVEVIAEPLPEPLPEVITEPEI